MDESWLLKETLKVLHCNQKLSLFTGIKVIVLLKKKKKGTYLTHTVLFSHFCRVYMYITSYYIMSRQR